MPGRQLLPEIMDRQAWPVFTGLSDLFKLPPVTADRMLAVVFLGAQVFQKLVNLVLGAGQITGPVVDTN